MRQLFFFSDSVIKGVMHENGRYKLCEDHDFASLNARGIEAHNHSKMGATIRTGLDIMRRKLTPCDEETLVLLSFGGNDCDYNWAEVAADPDGIHMPHIEPDEFAALYREAIELARASGAKVAAASIVPIEARRYSSGSMCAARSLTSAPRFYRAPASRRSCRTMASTLPLPVTRCCIGLSVPPSAA